MSSFQFRFILAYLEHQNCAEMSPIDFVAAGLYIFIHCSIVAATKFG